MSLKILAIDSSAVSASVAITDGEKLISESYVNIGLTHSETLLPMVDATLKNAGLSIKDIDRFCVTHGPGSFTGIRIGISTVKGLSQAENKPCYGVSTLEAMAYQHSDFNGIICCSMDARCGQVYTALFSCNRNVIKRLTEDIAISLEELYNILCRYGGNILLCGDGAEVCKNFLDGKLDRFVIANEQHRFQRAYGSALCSLYRNDGNEAVHTGISLNPVYIRPPQAERELKLKKGN